MNAKIVPEFQETPEKRPTHLLSLSVTTTDVDRWTYVHNCMSRLAAEWGPNHDQVSVSSVMMDYDQVLVSEEDLRYDEGTMDKVRQALGGVIRSFHLPEEPLVQALVNEMQNAGILFRERA